MHTLLGVVPKDRYKVDERVILTTVSYYGRNRVVEEFRATIIASFQNGRGWTHRLRLDGVETVVGNIPFTSLRPLLNQH